MFNLNLCETIHIVQPWSNNGDVEKTIKSDAQRHILLNSWIV